MDDLTPQRDPAPASSDPSAGLGDEERCPYAGCLGPADGSECRHPDEGE